jgi:hypothetical protein
VIIFFASSLETGCPIFPMAAISSLSLILPFLSASKSLNASAISLSCAEESFLSFVE